MTPEDRAELAESVRPWAIRRARAMLPEAEVEDAVQEAVIAAWKASARFPRDTNTWPFLQVAARGALGVYARKFYERTPRAAVVPDEPARYDMTAAHAEAGTEAEVVRAALATLAPRERAAVVLIDLLDVAPEDAARCLGLSPQAGSLRQARRRAHKKLRPILTEQLEGAL